MESMALNRLEWIASALDALAPEQSGFRRLRSTADSIADVVATLEHAASRHEAAYLVLLDVERAFDGLPHGTIIQALRELRITGRLLDYVSAFLSDRTLRCRAAFTTDRRLEVDTLESTAKAASRSAATRGFIGV
ncbi:uncharacterized protein [Dermacentor andersoni]|uniref:uncharacterized protein n=1 Tax=Dermacentor andersoni TaxID=34620 RepID=UPI003B3BD216